MEEFYYHGVWRTDWGFGNPNKTAALIATLMITTWSFVYIRKWGFWLALVLFTGLGMGLVHTFSRGGMIALLIGLFPVIYYSPHPWPRNRIIGIIASILIMIGFSIYLNAQERFEQGFTKEDRSITHRLQIWKAAPEMMVDAPWGWGIGNSGQAYTQWYQPLDQSEAYRTLVNSHLTWLVELGWPLRFLYILTWLLTIFACWPTERSPFFAIFFGIWLAFAVAAIFSSVTESLVLWIVPLLALLVTLVTRIHKQEWPELRLWAIPISISCLMIIFLVFLGCNGASINVIDRGVILGKGEPGIWVVVDSRIMGNRYGHTLRRYLSNAQGNHDSVGVVQSVAQLPGVAGKTVVIAGAPNNLTIAKAVLISAQRDILLSPSFLPQDVGATKGKPFHFVIYFGELSQSVAINTWADYGELKRIEGAGDFLPQWPELIFAVK